MEIILTVIGSILIVLLGIIGFFLKKTLKDLEQRIKYVEEEQKEQGIKQNKEMNLVKMNYLDRFDKMKDHQQEVKEEILKAINELTNEIREQKQFCYLMQEHKKKEKHNEHNN